MYAQAVDVALLITIRSSSCLCIAISSAEDKDEAMFCNVAAKLSN